MSSPPNILTTAAHSRHLCTRAGVEGFSLQDVARPDGLRLRKTLSIVRNLLAFKNERADFINSTIQRMEDAKQREQELLEEEQRLREEYNAMLYVCTTADRPLESQTMFERI